MAKMENSVIARYSSGGERFEILVDPDLAMKVKKGQEVNIEDLLVIDTVFKDAGKGEEKSAERIKATFQTTDIKEIAKKIIREGEVQLTTQQRREIMEARRKEVIALIAKNAMNPQTKAPHPPARIENALTEAKISIDYNQSAHEQLPKILKELKKLIPISMENLKIAVKIPTQFTGKANVILHRYDLKQQEWGNDGSLMAVIEIPAGLKQDLFNELNHLTHGTVESKILEK